MQYRYKTRGTCAQEILFELDDDRRVHNIQFVGGCNGNTKGVAVLAEGLTADEIEEKLSGIRCGFKSTSCPDQLALAVQAAVRQATEA